MVKISDEELVARLKALARDERALLGEVLRLLKEVEERGIPANTENPTLYAFCLKVLGFSEPQAYWRIQVTRLMSKVPEVVAAIEDGRISLSVAAAAQVCFKQAEKKKTPVPQEEQKEIIRSLFGLSAREADKKLADRFPERPKRQKSEQLGNGFVRVSFTIHEDLFEDVQELFRIRSHTNPEKRWEKLLVDLVKLGWRKWHPLSRWGNKPRTSYEAPGREQNQQDQAH